MRNLFLSLPLIVVNLTGCHASAHIPSEVIAATALRAGTSRPFGIDEPIVEDSIGSCGSIAIKDLNKEVIRRLSVVIQQRPFLDAPGIYHKNYEVTAECESTTMQFKLEIDVADFITCRDLVGGIATVPVCHDHGRLGVAEFKGEVRRMFTPPPELSRDTMSRPGSRVVLFHVLPGNSDRTTTVGEPEWDYFDNDKRDLKYIRMGCNQGSFWFTQYFFIPRRDHAQLDDMIFPLGIRPKALDDWYHNMLKANLAVQAFVDAAIGRRPRGK